MKKQFVVGKQFGRLIVIAECEGRYLLCVCECGNSHVAKKQHVVEGKIQSCGCLMREVNRNLHTTHGMYQKDGLYRVWSCMKVRCYNQNSFAYRWYGARGISVCSEWLNDYPSFKSWAVKNGWREGLEIDRVDNDGNYSPDNCRFVTRAVNADNRRTGRKWDAFGESKSAREWSLDSRCSVPYAVLKQRLTKGMEIERAITSPRLINQWL